mmetsp:Transcript_37345/g.76608  ORF Transcript_37345/g.76608 Transcript_37345/m.76608 type:complete len:268 (-) Transcript_37345:112-915(-)
MQHAPQYRNEMVVAQPVLDMNQKADTSGDTFDNHTRILVTQQFEILELCGIEAKNRYRISTEDNPAETFLFAQETGDGCERVCCSLCRSMTMNIHLGHDKNGPVVLSMQKERHCQMLPCPILLHPGAWIVTCPWLCIAAASKDPEFIVRKGNEVLGSILDPSGPAFQCKGNSLIRDATGCTLYETGPLCLCSSARCCPCLEEEAVHVTTPAGERVASITRKAMTCAELCGKMNRFVVDFGSVRDPTHRALIFAAGMMFDLQYWEQKQ